MLKFYCIFKVFLMLVLLFCRAGVLASTETEKALIQKQKEAYFLLAAQKFSPFPTSTIIQTPIHNTAKMEQNPYFKKHFFYLQHIQKHNWNSTSYSPDSIPVFWNPAWQTEIVNNRSILAIPNYKIGKIEVSIVEQKAYIYNEDNELLFTSLVVTGKNGFNTPSGQWKIISKTKNFYMQGNLNGYQWRVWTNYASFFTRWGHALHDAPWRSKFGLSANYRWNGSHGCVNMPLAAGKYIYLNATYNTIVKVY